MRILFLIHRPQARGQEIFASQLAQVLSDRGNEVFLMSLYTGDFALPFSGKPIDLGLKSGKQVWNPLQWKHFHRIASEFNPDVIQANGGDTLKFLAVVSFFNRLPGKLIFNNGGVMGHYLRNALQKSLNRFFLGQMSGLISVSEYSKSDVESLFSLNLPHQVIRIGVKFPERILKLEPEITWVHIGGFSPEKNHIGLLELFSKALNLGIQGKLLLIGDGPLKSETEYLASEFGLSDRVRFLGNHPNPWSEVPSPAILLLPSKVEGMPAVIGEALGLGVPVIAYRVGGIGELESEFSSLHCISPEDQSEFIWVMLDMQNNLNQSLRKASQESEKAQMYFDLDGAVDHFLTFYKSL
jgi:L-malate glycosyltransferase